MKAVQPLRVFVLAAAALGVAFCIGALIWWWRIPSVSRDGMETIGLALTGAFFVVLVLPTLLLGLIGRWLHLAALLGIAVLVLASDTLWHWLPWWD